METANALLYLALALRFGIGPEALVWAVYFSAMLVITGIDLAHAMIRNPQMKVLVQQGYYDLATPYRATEYFVDQMPLPASLRKNVTIDYYEAGHMMYVHPPSLEQYRKDLAGFIDNSL